MSEVAVASKKSWCSWCGCFCDHLLHIERVVGRSAYQCVECNHLTVQCRYCENMAKAGSSEKMEEEGVLDEDAAIAEEVVEEAEISVSSDYLKKTSKWGLSRDSIRSALGGTKSKVSKYFTDNWDNELCAEHDGSIADFSKAHLKVDDLGGFKELMKPRRKNIYGATKKIGMVAGGVAAVGTGAWMTAPGIAAAIGGTGVLGAAGTGTAISSLSGAALTSASVAKVGAGGLAIIAATGSALGGKTGYGLATSYMKDIPDYDFIRLRSSAQRDDHAIVVVNGFLTQDDKNGYDWYAQLDSFERNSPIWYLNWEAKTLSKLGGLIARGGTDIFTRFVTVGGASRASALAAKALAKGGGALAAVNLMDNPWHSAMLNAEKAGVLLAEAICRTEGKTHTLIGHSLGARVIYYALRTLATKGGDKFVDNVILMGGAVGTDVEDDWLQATSAVSGKVYNCYSNKDGILKGMYRTANLFMSSPAGLQPAPGQEGKIVNVDFSEFDEIDGHNDWKPNLPLVLKELGF